MYRTYWFLGWALLWCCFTAVLTAADRKPNFLIFLCDDVGWGEFGFQGNQQILTPHIDSIAKNGVRFAQGYVAATYCSPCRAGLMTGRYPTRFGHEFNGITRTSGLNLQEKTMADRLKTLGYSTLAVGKWHLGDGPEYRPTKRGFDEFFGTVANTPFYHPPQFVDSRVSEQAKKIEDPNFYTTDAYGDHVVQWLEKHQQEPWFVYLPFNAQHAPLQAPKKYLDRFPKIEDKNRQLFAAMMSAMDDAVGKVLAKIRELGQEENTLVVFLADNGGPTKTTTSSNGPLRGFKSTTFEGGTRVPFCMQWKGKLPAGKTYESPIIQLDLLPTMVTAAGGKVEADWKLDGVNLLPYLTGEKQERPHETLFWRFGDQWAVRHGDLKLVKGNGGGPEPELYDLAKDVGESKNLAGEQPEQVKTLQALWNGWNSQQAPAASPQETPKAKAKNKKKVAETAN